MAATKGKNSPNQLEVLDRFETGLWTLDDLSSRVSPRALEKSGTPFADEIAYTWTELLKIRGKVEHILSNQYADVSLLERFFDRRDITIIPKLVREVGLAQRNFLAEMAGHAIMGNVVQDQPTLPKVDSVMHRYGRVLNEFRDLRNGKCTTKEVYRLLCENEQWESLGFGSDTPTLDTFQRNIRRYKRKHLGLKNSW